MKVFKIPSVYTAVDKFTQPMRGMVQANQRFASSLETGVARSERIFRKLTPAISESTKQLFSWAKSAAIAGAVIGGITFSVGAMKDYETQVQSFRTIVSDLSDKEFKVYQDALNAVALDTRKSAIDTAMAAEKIAGLNAKFAETSEGISEVTRASILLSKASRDELGSSAESLVGIMNQYGFAANQANRTVNALAAGTAVGASSIKQTAEAFVNFGAVASSANVTLEQSVGLIQTMGKFSIFGSEAGNKLKGVLLRLQKAGVGYASGQFNINDALAETQSRLDKLKTPLAKDRMLIKLFGAENISAGKSLVSSIGLFKEFTQQIGGKTTAAMDQAAINSNTLQVRLDELKNTWVNLLVSNDKANASMVFAKDAIKFVTDNLGTIVGVGFKVLAFFAAWKAILLVTRAGLIAYNVVLGITGALSGAASIAIGKNAVALGAYNVATKAVTAAQWLWNAAMAANPIGLIVLGIVALIALVTVVIKKWDEWGAALAIFLGPLGLVLSIIQSLRRNWDLVVKGFTEGGILGGLKAIGVVLMDAVLQPIQQIVELIAKVTGAEWATSAAKSIEGFRQKIGANVEPVVNSKATQQEATNSTIENIQKQQATLTIQNETNNSAKLDSKGDFIPMKLKSTWGG
jgi:TP901 family phage tail tape measure protein